MNSAQRISTLLLVLVAGLTPISCDSRRDEFKSDPVRVFAAASLTDVVEALAESYDAPTTTSFGGSSALARQIRDGAPADIFLSASPRWIQYLRGEGALGSEPIVLARNRLVAIVPADEASRSRWATADLGDARALLDHLSPQDRIAIADEGVPAGEYARAALSTLGLLASYEAHLVGQTDVRAVLNAVEQGEMQAGFVYSTDARVARVQVLFSFDPATHPPIEYQAAVLRGSANHLAARSFLAHLQGESARALLMDAGFELP